MRTRAEYERIAYLDRGASGASYDAPAAVSQLAEQIDLPIRQIKKMIGGWDAASAPRRVW